MKLMRTTDGLIVELITITEYGYPDHFCRILRDRVPWGHNGYTIFGTKYKDYCKNNCWFYRKDELTPFTLDNREEAK